MTKKFMGSPCNRAWPQVTRPNQPFLGRELCRQGLRTEFAERVVLGDRANVNRFDDLLKAFSKFDALKADQSPQLEADPSNEDLGGSHVS